MNTILYVMGRNKVFDNTKILSVKVCGDDHDKLKQKAKGRGMRLSTFVRYILGKEVGGLKEV